MRKINVGVTFGGKSAEHEVSLQSAKNIIEAIDKKKYEVTLIGVDKYGKFYLHDKEKYLNNENDSKLIELVESKEELAFVLGRKGKSFYNILKKEFVKEIDVIFPIIHGPFGEDGSLQGLLKLVDIPFVGAEVIGSAVGMDKDVMKRLLRDGGIEIPKFIVVKNEYDINYEYASGKLGKVIFIKPANLGSSVGISKTTNEKEFKKGIIKALKYDKKVILEEFIDGREIECSVKGNDIVTVSTPGEILPENDFYSYEAKYINDGETRLEIPAKLTKLQVKNIKEIAIKVYKILESKGLSRIDFFVIDEKIYVNEINTLPGFTKISMYPKLWQVDDISYTELITELIELAIEEHTINKKLVTNL